MPCALSPTQSSEGFNPPNASPITLSLRLFEKTGSAIVASSFSECAPTLWAVSTATLNKS